ncbi:MAG: ATP-binding protein [Steroidobacteraceae bacterium]
MSKRVDLTLGERLGLGFAAMMVGLGLFTSAVLYFGAQSARAQRVYLEDITPLYAQAEALERSMLYIAIGMRDLMLYSQTTTPEQLRHRLETVRSELARLESMPKPPAGARLLPQIEARVSAYADEAAAALAPERSSADRLAMAYALAQLREAALADIRGYRTVLQRESEAAAAIMTLARERVTIGSLILVALAAVFGLASAWLMTRSVSRPLRDLTDVSGALGRGDWQPALDLAARLAPAGGGDAAPRSETGRLAQAFATAAVQVQAREKQLRARADVSAAISSSVDKSQIAGRVLAPIAAHMGAEVAAIYWHEPAGRLLRPLGTLAPEGSLSPLASDEDIPGEAAQTRSTVLVRGVPGDTPFGVKPGDDRAAPRTVIATPVQFKDSLLGVLLVAGPRDFEPDAVSFLETVARELGIGLQNALSYEEAQDLLGRLSASNERIRTQNQELKGQAEKIQAQNEELRNQREELRSQARALAEVDERKNHFLAVLAHELRNPMAPLTTSLEILRRSPAESDAALQAQEVIGRQTRQLVRLVDDLLDVTRISRGKLHLERETLDLAEVARACADDQAPILAGRSLAFDVELPSGPLRVHGDRARLAQVIGNLIHNAAKFTDAGGRIRLRLREDHAAGQAVLEVIDSGVGMDAELMSRLFQPFSQGPTGLARSNAGLGLGLALVKSLVSMHDGTVEARSEGPGRGAEFIVRLPLVTADRDGGAAAAASPARLRVVKRVVKRAAKGAAADAPQKWRVLVIDDYVDAAMGLRTLLRLDGHEVEVAASGAEGLEKARAFEPHLVFCDIGLPVMTGYEVARHLRAEQGARPLLLVALTGYTSEADQARCMEAGFDRHFAKPLDPGLLDGIFEELARRHA